jgi:hypothetical protein
MSPQRPRTGQPHESVYGWLFTRLGSRQAKPEGGARETSAQFIDFAAWNAFASDPEWLVKQAERVADGIIVERIGNTILTPTVHSALR